MVGSKRSRPAWRSPVPILGLTGKAHQDLVATVDRQCPGTQPLDLEVGDPAPGEAGYLQIRGHLFTRGLKGHIERRGAGHHQARARAELRQARRVAEEATQAQPLPRHHESCAFCTPISGTACWSC